MVLLFNIKIPPRNARTRGMIPKNLGYERILREYASIFLKRIPYFRINSTHHTPVMIKAKHEKTVKKCPTGLFLKTLMVMAKMIMTRNKQIADNA